MKVKYLTHFLFIFMLGVFVAWQPQAFAQTAFQTYFERGEKAYNQGVFPEAIKYFNRALEEDPNSAEVYYRLGLIYRDKGAKFNTTAWYFKVALDIDPEYVEAHHTLAGIYNQAGYYDLAIEEYTKVLELNPQQLSAHFALAWTYLNGKGQPADAIFHFKKVLEKGDIPEAYLGMGIAYSRQENRPMVLDTITILRDKGFNEFASQLEAIIRQQDAINNPPQPRTPQVPIFQGQVPQTPPQRQSLSAPVATPVQIQPQAGPAGGAMRVRLRGQLYNKPQSDDDNMQEETKPAPPPRPQRPVYNSNVLESK